MPTLSHISGSTSQSEIETRILGKTSLRASVLGFGASPLGDVFERIDATEALAAVHYAVDRGINFFDVSPYYGSTLAESRLGEALEGYRSRVILATKCGRYGVDQFDFSATAITAGFEDSLRRLRTDHVDLLQAHDVEFGDAEQIVHETIPAMRRLQQQGKARYIGISGYSLRNLISIASRVQVDTVLSYCRYNLLIGDLDQTLLPFALENGIGVINASPLHMGILTERGAPSWHPAPRSVHEVGRRVMQLCSQHGQDGVQVALRYCLDHPSVTTTLVGMATREQVDTNLHALSAARDPDLLAEIRALVDPVYGYVWASGRPENNA